MKVAIPVWKNRVAPVFDTADRWLSISVTGDRWKIEQEVAFADSLPEMKVQELLQQKVEYLICGAIPYRYESFLKSTGCEVSSFIAGKPEDVIQALIDNNIGETSFLMPGCRQLKE
ncbi:MAG: dinitrogenase iron-molybdenum cofactor biosynthesis protein [Spirochaetaceae bacterium]|nr:dinitrogenase iron-molybdenum cofactor biosynthesis protein [Spirochaetaceae bacterium]